MQILNEKMKKVSKRQVNRRIELLKIAIEYLKLVKKDEITTDLVFAFAKKMEKWVME